MALTVPRYSRFWKPSSAKIRQRGYRCSPIATLVFLFLIHLIHLIIHLSTAIAGTLSKHSDSIRPEQK